MSKGSTKYDEGKPMYTSVPLLALEEITKVFTYGANKYAKYNYSLGSPYTRYIDAALRHINAFLKGEDIDESGYLHLAHAAASIMVTLDNIKADNGTDDRNPNYKRNV